MALPFLQAELVRYVTQRVLEALRTQLPREQLTGASAGLATEELRLALEQFSQSQALLAQRLAALEAATQTQQAQLEQLTRRPPPAPNWPLLAVTAAAGSLSGAALVLVARLAGLW